MVYVPLQKFRERLQERNMSERILRFPDVKARTGLSRSTIYLRINEGLFPLAILLGKRMVGWRESEVAAMNAARIRGANDDEIRSLVTKLEEARRTAS